MSILLIILIIAIVFGIIAIAFGNVGLGIIIIAAGALIFYFGTFFGETSSFLLAGLQSTYQSITGYLFGGNGLGPYLDQAKSTFSKFYGNLQQVEEILSNPQAYVAQQELQPTANSQSQQTSLSISPISSQGPYFIVPINSQEAYTELQEGYLLTVNLPSNYQYPIPVRFSCLISVDYPPACYFNTTPSVSIQSTTINSTYYNLPIYCLAEQIKLNLSTCNYQYGMVLSPILYANFQNIFTQTQYNFLAVSLNVLAEAEEKYNGNVYQLLNLNPADFDKGYFEGIQGLPTLGLFRAMASSGYPLIINGDQTSYDVILLSLNGLVGTSYYISQIDNLTLNIYYKSSELNLEFVNTNGQCSDSLSYSSEFSIYNYTCEDYPSNNYAVCIFQFNDNFLLQYEQSSQAQSGLLIGIPICVSAGSSFNGVSEVSLNAIYEYNLDMASSASVDYIYENTQQNQ